MLREAYQIVKGQLLVTVNVRAETGVRLGNDVSRNARVILAEGSLIAGIYGVVCSMVRNTGLVDMDLARPASPSETLTLTSEL